MMSGMLKLEITEFSRSIEHERETDIHTDDRQWDYTRRGCQWRRYEICQRVVLIGTQNLGIYLFDDKWLIKRVCNLKEVIM